jgi:tRNA 2-thiouridine synthesizing protein A
MSSSCQLNALHFDQDWDAGDLGCGELVIHLRFRLRAMQPGQVLRVHASDAGAPEDLPAWCRMTGATLVHHDPGQHRFFIRRGER